MVPLFFAEVREIIAKDVFLQESVDDAGVEVVACSDSADGFDTVDLVALLHLWGEEAYVAVGVGAEHVLAVEVYLVLVDAVGVAASEHIVEVFG